MSIWTESFAVRPVLSLGERWTRSLVGRAGCALTAGAILAAPSTEVFAQDRAKKRVDAREAGFYVLINPRKDSGHPWHGPGDIFILGGKMVTHFPEAPGAVLCLVTTNGEATCPGQREEARPPPTSPSASAAGRARSAANGKLGAFLAKKPISPCPSAYSCEFEEIKLPADEMFGVVVIDPAMTLINLVDAVIITRTRKTRKDPDVVTFDPRLREAINKLAPPLPFEAKRRQRRFEVRTLDECKEGCKFSQSEITIDLD